MILTFGMFGQEKMLMGMWLSEILIGLKSLRSGSRANKPLHSEILLAPLPKFR